jgi:predicted RNase H-like nuclease (RuvC/YqgF family)
MTKEADTNQTDSTELETLRKHKADLERDLKAVKSERDNLKTEKEEAETDAAEKAGDIEKLKSQLEKSHQKAIDALTTERDNLAAELKDIRVNSEISAAISRSNIITDYVEGVEALMLRKVTYGDGVATIDGQPIADWSKAYFAKAGAIYVNAANNNGADTLGNNGDKAARFQKPNGIGEIPIEVQRLATTDKPQYNSLMDSWGFPEAKV